MNRIVIAAVASLAFAGAALAQEAPQLQGDYSANVSQDSTASSQTVEVSGAASATRVTNSSAQGGYSAAVRSFDILSGK